MFILGILAGWSTLGLISTGIYLYERYNKKKINKQCKDAYKAGWNNGYIEGIKTKVKQEEA